MPSEEERHLGAPNQGTELVLTDVLQQGRAAAIFCIIPSYRLHAICIVTSRVRGSSPPRGYSRGTQATLPEAASYRESCRSTV
jgi:hypothetical protein